MIKIIKVTGNSLSPLFLPGDFVITSKSSRILKNLQTEDIIIFNHLDFGVLIKRITSIDPAKQLLTVSGTHPDSIDANTLGSIHFRDVVGKVIWHIKKSRF